MKPNMIPNKRITIWTWYHHHALNVLIIVTVVCCMMLYCVSCSLKESSIKYVTLQGGSLRKCDSLWQGERGDVVKIIWRHMQVQYRYFTHLFHGCLPNGPEIKIVKIILNRVYQTIWSEFIVVPYHVKYIELVIHECSADRCEVISAELKSVWSLFCRPRWAA